MADDSVPVLAKQIETKLQLIRQAMRKELEEQYASGHLTGPQRLVMESLCTSNRMSLKELSKAVCLAHSTVSGIVDRLERRGFLVRKTLESDRRVSLIEPSAAVQLFLKERAPALTLHPLTRALKKASPEERHAVLKGLATLEKLLT